MAVVLGTSLLSAQTQNSPSTEDLHNFSIEHRQQDQVNPADSTLIASRTAEIQSRATFYGYDMTASWAYEQSVCPLMPDTVMLRYFSKDAAGADSLFVAVVPRSNERVRIVPVLSHGTSRFKPAASDPRNFQLFNQLVPADVAKENSNLGGRWLLLSVCYAEMTGGQPQVPGQPIIDKQMLSAPAPIIRVAQDANEVRFSEPQSTEEYDLWQVSYNNAGQVVDASSDRRSFGTVTIAGTAAPAHTAINPPAPAPTANAIAPTATNQVQVIPAAASLNAKVIPQAPPPPIKVIPEAPPPPVKIIPASQLKLPPEKPMPQ